MNISDHDYSLSFSAEISIQALVTRIHADQVPDFESHLATLHLKQFKLIVRPNRRLIFLYEAITDKAIDNGSLAYGNVSKHNYLK